MAMPKTAINKDNCVVAWQYNIRFSGQIADIQPEPKTLTMQQAANQLLRLGILSLDTCHHATSGSGIDNVNHYDLLPYRRITLTQIVPVFGSQQFLGIMNNLTMLYPQIQIVCIEYPDVCD